MIEATVKFYDSKSNGYILFDGTSLYYLSKEKANNVKLLIGERVVINENNVLTFGEKNMKLVNKITKKD